jgi:hypothetical protein
VSRFDFAMSSVCAQSTAGDARRPARRPHQRHAQCLEVFTTEAKNVVYQSAWGTSPSETKAGTRVSD